MQYNRLTCDITVTKPTGNTIRFRECTSVLVDTSFANLTDTAEVEIPFESRWIQRDDGGYNTYQVTGSEGLFDKGDRIEIKLGYDFDDRTVFQGYIVAIEPGETIRLICEDEAHKLKFNQLNLSYKEPVKLSEVVDKLVEGTGVEIHPNTRTLDIDLGKLYVRGLSTAQLLKKWKDDYQLLSYIRDGKLLIGLSFFQNSDSIQSSNEAYQPPAFSVQRHIIDHDLTVESLGRDELALKAISTFASNKKLELTVVADPNDPVGVILIDKVDGRLSEAARNKEQVRVQKEAVDQELFIEKFTPRTLNGYGLEEEALLAYAQAHFTSFTNSGLTGSFTTFGDHDLKPATTVILLDDDKPDLNGEYIIQSVDKTFGDGGYRHKVTVPFKFKKID